MPDRFLQLRLTEEQYAQLESEGTRLERPMSWVAKNRIFNPRGVDIKPTTTVTSTKPSNTGTTADMGYTESVEDNFGFVPGDRQEESAVASDVAEATITRTKPKDGLNAKAALTKPRRPGEYSASEMADIDAERLARMKTGKKK